LLHAASCFFVEIGATRFGITAFHVIAEYLADRAKHPGGFLMIRNTMISDWDARFIDSNEICDSAWCACIEKGTLFPECKSLDGNPIPPTTKNVPISGIRLSDQLHREAHGEKLWSQASSARRLFSFALRYSFL